MHFDFNLLNDVPAYQLPSKLRNRLSFLELCTLLLLFEVATRPTLVPTKEEISQKYLLMNFKNSLTGLTRAQETLFLLLVPSFC